jgi:hypothetical protein
MNIRAENPQHLTLLCARGTPPAVAPVSGCTNGHDWIFHIDSSGVVEFQSGFDRLALFKRMLEVAEHDVEARWRKRDGFSRLDFSPLQGALASSETQLTLSGVVPLLVIVM